MGFKGMSITQVLVWLSIVSLVIGAAMLVLAYYRTLYSHLALPGAILWFTGTIQLIAAWGLGVLQGMADSRQSEP